MLLIWLAAALVISALIAYGSVLGFLYLRQRSIMYLPDGNVIAPAEVGLARAEVVAIETRDGQRLVGWFIAPAPRQPLLLYFHGNAGNLGDLAVRFEALTADGLGLMAIDYRGFGGSSGQPTEAGLALDADATYTEARERGFAPAEIVIVGESLGTGVAVALAAQVECAGVILEAAFSSATDIAAARYRMFPVRGLLHDHFECRSAIARIRAPLFFVHGTNDLTIPIAFGRALFAVAPQPKEFVTVDGGEHQVMQRPGVVAKIAAWIAALPRKDSTQPPTREAPLRAT